MIYIYIQCNNTHVPTHLKDLNIGQTTSENICAAADIAISRHFNNTVVDALLCSHERGRQTLRATDAMTTTANNGCQKNYSLQNCFRVVHRSGASKNDNNRALVNLLIQIKYIYCGSLRWYIYILYILYTLYVRVSCTQLFVAFIIVYIIIIIIIYLVGFHSRKHDGLNIGFGQCFRVNSGRVYSEM